MDSELRFRKKISDLGFDYPLTANSQDLTNMFLLRGSSDSSANAKSLVANKCSVLLKDLSTQRKTVKDLYSELEEERNAAASAANETMSMILRLQREKAEIQMEARQFKTFAEEKMTHDQEKLATLETLLYEKEQALEALSYEVLAYKHKLLSFGLTDPDSEEENPNPNPYPNPNSSGSDGIVQSPRWPYYDPNSPLGTAKEIKGTFFADSPMSNCSDRVYTIDSIHVGVSEVDETVKINGDSWNSQGDVEKLYSRLQALEADRESLRQIIVAMRSDKAELVLLREMAQKLSSEVNRRNPVIKIPSFKGFSLVTVFKWIVSLVYWKKKGRSNKKYVYKLSANNMGMLMILGDGSRRWKCLTTSQF